MKYEKIREAMSLPGFRWMPGMLDDGLERYIAHDSMETPSETNGTDGGWKVADSPRTLDPERLITPDDPATGGCLLELLGTTAHVWRCTKTGEWCIRSGGGSTLSEYDAEGHTLGQACIAAALALGRWPGGAP